MINSRGAELKERVNEKNLWNEPLFCDVIESYLCIKKHKGRFEVVHDHSGIRHIARWSGVEVTKKLLL